MDNIFEKMTTAELEKFKQTYKDNPSIVTIVDTAIAQRKAEEAAAQAKAKFADGIAKLVGKLPHPDDIYNIYIRWAEVEESTGEPAEEVEVVGTDGKKTTESRQPMHKVYKWVVEVNKAFSVAKIATSTTTATTSKRAITVSKRNATNPAQLDLVGHFRTGHEACGHLKIDEGQGSANLALSKAGYFTEPMREGASFTIAKQ